MRTWTALVSIVTVLAGVVAAPGPAGAAPAEAAPAAPRTITVPAPAAARAPAGAFAAAQAAAQVAAKIHHYNICNANREVCSISQAKVARDVLLFLAVADGAWIITVNEICLGSFERLTTDLNAAGTFVESLVRHDSCVGKPFGNAIIHPGAIKVDGRAWYLATESRNCAAVECRTMLCLKLSTYAGPMGQCVAHLGGWSDDPDTRTKVTVHHAAEYIWNATSYMEPGRRFSLAGDFNLTRDQLPGAYDGFADLVTGPTYATRPGPPSKHIDYIFVQRVGSYTAKPAYCPTDASDHCHTSGEWSPA